MLCFSMFLLPLLCIDPPAALEVRDGCKKPLESAITAPCWAQLTPALGSSARADLPQVLALSLCDAAQRDVFFKLCSQTSARQPAHSLPYV